MTKRDIEITTPVRRELVEDFLKRIDADGGRYWRETRLGTPYDNRRLVVVARSFREADDYLRSIRVHRKDALVIVGYHGIDKLRTLHSDTARVVSIGHWQDGFREMEMSELRYHMQTRNLEVTHVQDWR